MNGWAGIREHRARVDIAVDRIVKTLIAEGATLSADELDFVVRKKFLAVPRADAVLRLMRNLFTRPAREAVAVRAVVTHDHFGDGVLLEQRGDVCLVRFRDGATRKVKAGFLSSNVN
jgi:hypothetical protein